ncbi:immunity 52 family protein [Archangium sp.]|uniref:immunity 52 family protein n=1 Tax=Archangium sp. TaxID=1872627 RepID=UPI00286CCEFD|nr:immunity 52 family protein [Archangium sp.]
MIETYYAGAYWGVRKESPEECGQRAEVMFNALRTVDPDFAHWLKLRRTRKEALQHPLETDRASLTKTLRRRKDRMFEDLGFRLDGWNGADGHEASSFLMTVGCYSEYVSNACAFTLPSAGSDNKEGPNAQRVLTATVLSGLVRAMAVAWDPDWAIATSHTHRELLPTPHPERLWGWVTYYPDRVGRVPPLPAPVRMERVEDKGTLFVLTPERFTASNPEHVALAHRVGELLGRAGLLGPPRH